jgi:hypothetical protein
MRRERRSWRISALPLLLLLPPSSRVVVHSFPLVSAAAAAAAAVRESCGAMEADQPATRDLLEHALGWTSARGLGAGVKNSEGLWTTTHLPFALLPNSLPASSLEEVQALAPIFNELVDKISRDGEWLTTVLKDTAAGDDFTRELLKVRMARHESHRTTRAAMLTFPPFFLSFFPSRFTKRCRGNLSSK